MFKLIIIASNVLANLTKDDPYLMDLTKENLKILLLFLNHRFMQKNYSEQKGMFYQIILKADFLKEGESQEFFYDNKRRFFSVIKLNGKIFDVSNIKNKVLYDKLKFDLLEKLSCMGTWQIFEAMVFLTKNLFLNKTEIITRKVILCNYHKLLKDKLFTALSAGPQLKLTLTEGQPKIIFESSKVKVTVTNSCTLWVDNNLKLVDFMHGPLVKNRINKDAQMSPEI